MNMRLLLSLLVLSIIIAPLTVHAELSGNAVVGKKPVFEQTTQLAKKITSKITIKDCEVILPKYTLKKTNIPYMPNVLKSEPSDKKITVKSAHCKTPNYIDQSTMSVGQNLKSVGKYNPKIMLNKIP